MSLSGVKGSACTGQVSGAQGVFALTSGELLVDPLQRRGRAGGGSLCSQGAPAARHSCPEPFWGSCWP